MVQAQQLTKHIKRIQGHTTQRKHKRKMNKSPQKGVQTITWIWQNSRN